MKNESELLQEAQDRTTVDMGVSTVSDLYEDCMRLAARFTQGGKPLFWNEMRAHTRLLGIVVCTNEKGIDTWVEQLQELWSEYS